MNAVLELQKLAQAT
ncbi:class III lanthipeptide, partial [Paenibacillus thiaminolyticus]